MGKKSQLNFQPTGPKYTKSKARCGNKVVLRWGQKITGMDFGQR